MPHLLIQHSYRFTPDRELSVIGWKYDRVAGMWVADTDAAFPEGEKPRPTSKKADRETGEDMKGP